MYQFSRRLYRELSALAGLSPDAAEARRMLDACERTIERLATDRHYFARPTRSLFLAVRHNIPMRHQRAAYELITEYLRYAVAWIEAQPLLGLDHHGQPLQCRATTRRGTACQRTPLPRNGYCPSHQHLAETEHRSNHELMSA